MISPDDQARFRPCLLTGERLLWTGRPRRGLAFRAADLYLIPVVLAWTGLTASRDLDIWRAPGGGDPFSYALAVPLLAFGLYLLVGRFLHDAWIRAHLFYAVTNDRVLILRSGPFGSLRSLQVGYLPLLELEEHRDGRGTIRFDLEEDQSPWWASHNLAFWTSTASRIMRFDRVAQPRTVYELIRRESERWRGDHAVDRGSRNFIG